MCPKPWDKKTNLAQVIFQCFWGLILSKIQNWFSQLFTYLHILEAVYYIQGPAYNIYFAKNLEIEIVWQPAKQAL